MGTKRIPDRAGCVGNWSKRLPECRYCRGTITERGRRTFCSDECVHQHKIRTQPGYAAEQVEKRDHGICVTCGRDCAALMGELRDLAVEITMGMRFEHRCCETGVGWTWDCRHDRCRRIEAVAIANGKQDARSYRLWVSPQWLARCDELDLPRNLRQLSRRLWEMDHIIPVCEGGGDCGLDNLRTLCWSCHRKETTRLQRRRRK